MFWLIGCNHRCTLRRCSDHANDDETSVLLPGAGSSGESWVDSVEEIGKDGNRGILDLVGARYKVVGSRESGFVARIAG